MTTALKILLISVPCGALVALSPWQLWGLEVAGMFAWMAWKVTE